MARKKKTESVDEAKEEIISGYKGFDKDFTCRGFQYEVGREYTCEEAVICQQGFHLCENPLHVLRYYSPTASRFAEAEGRGNLERHKADSKVACTKIKINGEIDLKGLINAGMDFVFSRVKWGEADTSQTHGDSSAAQTHGSYSAAQTHGNYSAAQVDGKQSIAVSTGFKGKAKGALTCWLTLAEWAQINGDWQIKCVKSALVDGTVIKADCWYTLKGGEFTEA